MIKKRFGQYIALVFVIDFIEKMYLEYKYNDDSIESSLRQHTHALFEISKEHLQQCAKITVIANRRFFQFVSSC